jgi:thiol-disulfide isomerase/thioredoxin
MQDGNFTKLENKNNTFEIKGKCDKVRKAEIWYGFNSQIIYYGPGTTTLTIYTEDKNKNIVKGCKENKLLNVFNNEFSSIDINDAEKRKQLIKNFINENKNSIVSIHLFAPGNTKDWDIKEYKESFDQLANHVKQSYEGEIIAKTIQVKENAAIGREFIEISLPGIHGDTIALSNVVKKNKLTVLDFWSSTCGYCRDDAQVLLKYYPELKDKGLEVFACSLDRRKDRWIKAIEKDKTNWLHVMDKDHTTANNYYLTAIPVVLVINNEGKIIANDLARMELVEFLRKELKK